MDSVVGLVAISAGLIIGLGAAGACIGIGIMGIFNHKFLRLIDIVHADGFLHVQIVALDMLQVCLKNEWPCHRHQV